MKIDEERRRRAVVTHQVAHQDIQHVVVYSNRYSIRHYSKEDRIASRRELAYAVRMIKSVKFISIPVRDQNKALDFYTKKLGFRIMTDQPFGGGQRWIELGIPGAATGVVLFTPPGQESLIGTFRNIFIHVRRRPENS